MPTHDLEVRLHGEPKIGSLNPEGFSRPANFFRHAPLVFECEQMLDDRIAERDVEGARLDLTYIRRDSRQRNNIAVLLNFGTEVQYRNFDVVAVRPATLLPERVGTSNI